MEMAARLAGGCRPQSEPMKILHPLLTFIGVILIFHQATGVANPVFLAAGMTLIIGARLAMLLTPAPQKKSAPVNSWEREVRELFYADKIEVDELERLLEFAIRGLRPASTATALPVLAESGWLEDLSSTAAVGPTADGCHAHGPS
jgi:hypothetical protein